MAVLGSLIARWTYTLISGKSALRAKRRVVAAALAGYLAINVAAFAAAIEFGLQAMLFHDASGVPLYAPYSLAIAIPAMMIGHLSIAGFAEAAVAAGLVAYLQRANPELLTFSVANRALQLATTSVRQSTRRLWYSLAGLMILSPLGLMATGTAWGEWSVEDFTNAQTRHAIVQASGNVPLPEIVPQGLQRLASVWIAPIPDYASSLMHSASFAYILCAVLGSGLILLLSLLFSKFATKRALLESQEN